MSTKSANPATASQSFDTFIDGDDPAAIARHLRTLGQDDLNDELWNQAEIGDIEKATLCLAAGADPKAKPGGEETTPLARACICNQPEMVKFLAPISDLDATDYEGNTAAHRCCQEGSHECLLALIAAGDTLSTRNHNGESATFEAFRYAASIWEANEPGRLDSYARCLDAMIPAADLSATNGSGRLTPYELAISCGYPKLANAFGLAAALRDKRAISNALPLRDNHRQELNHNATPRI